MNKNKLVVLFVLLIAVVGLSMGAVAAKSTSKTKYKIVKLQPKFNKDTQKTVGKYKVITTKVKFSTDQWVYTQISKGNKYIKANKYFSKIYYKLQGKSHTTKWLKNSSKEIYHGYSLPKDAKVSKVAVKVPVK